MSDKRAIIVERIPIPGRPDGVPQYYTYAPAVGPHAFDAAPPSILDDIEALADFARLNAPTTERARRAGERVDAWLEQART